MSFTIKHKSAINDNVESELCTLSRKVRGAYCISDILKCVDSDHVDVKFKDFLKLRRYRKSFRGP